ncbi:MAG TPA: hypothetical protein EYP32_06020, partial [Aquificaceae bacterium]|nr:hypothetical protein [Aquificaceae bacterium]
PPSLASEIVVTASLMGDLDLVVDLGCGTGILAIASALLNAKAIGFDIDIEALNHKLVPIADPVVKPPLVGLVESIVAYERDHVLLLPTLSVWEL